MDNTGIYVISYKDKEYVGQTTVSFKKRWEQHKYCKEDDYFHRAIRKHGWENFKFEILHIVSKYEPIQEWRQELNILEEDTIIQKNCLAPNGYNSNKGGDNRECHSLTREKLRIANTGEKNPQFGKFGKDSPTYGRITSVEQKQHLREINSKKVEQWSKDGKTFIKIWNSAKEASIGICGTKYGLNISSVCKGKRKTSGKFTWKYHQETSIKKY